MVWRSRLRHFIENHKVGIKLTKKAWIFGGLAAARSYHTHQGSIGAISPANDVDLVGPAEVDPGLG